MTSLSLLPYAIRDMLNPRLMGYLLLSIILSGVLLIPILLSLAYGMFELFSSWLEQMNVEQWEGVFLMESIMFGIHAILIASLTWGVGLIFFSLYSILAIAILGFFTDKIVREVARGRYPDTVLLGDMNLFSMMLRMATGIGLHLLILIPLLVISLPFPFGTTLVVFYVLHSLFRYCLCLDVGSIIYPTREINTQAPTLGFKWGLPTGLCYLGGLIPFLNLLMPFCAVIWVTHCQLHEASGRAPQDKWLPHTPQA